MNGSAWVEWMTSMMGGVPRQASAAAFPPDRFYCLLDELPVHLIPRSVRRSGQIAKHDGEPLRLNPDCVIAAADQFPEEFRGREELLSGFALQGTIAWVRDEGTGLQFPFWLGRAFESMLSTILPGERIPDSFPPPARQLLLQAGIFIFEDSFVSRVNGENAINTAGASFREKGYAPISDLIHPFHVAALRRYYRYQIRTGAISLGDYQSARRYVAHNEPVARFFQNQIAAKLSAVAGEPLKPSYVYLASYLSGAELKKHTDREQCEFSITLCLDFSPEPELATPWPIRLDSPSGAVTVYQGIGDGLAYRGTKVPHSRAVLGEGRSSTSIFFHYVAKDFSGSLD